MVSTPTIRVIKKVMPAVVSISISRPANEVKKELRAATQNMGLPADRHGACLPQHPCDIPDAMIDSNGMVRVGSGSGFIVQHNGVIVTNKHVVNELHATYEVVLNDERKFPAVILARDPIEDIAILKINVTGLPTVKLGDSNTLELGEDIIAIGNALGLFRNTVSQGIVSGLARSIAASPDPNTPMQEMRGLIQTDAAINPGNSGGPLVNMKGEAIGINVAVVFGAQNLSFALPMHAVERDLEDLKLYGRIRRPLLGLRYIIIDEHVKDKMKLPVDYGALVISHGPQHDAVIPGSPAASAGIREHDIIVKCNNETLTISKTIQDFLETMEVGDALHLELLRGGKTMKLDVTLGERK